MTSFVKMLLLETRSSCPMNIFLLFHLRKIQIILFFTVVHKNSSKSS